MWQSSLAGVHYVDVSSTNATPPFSSWATAANNIQAAVDAAVAGDEVVVTNGLYATGGRAVYGTMTNRVAVNKPLVLRSVNGPQFTTIQGHQVPGGGYSGAGDGAIRCVYLANGARLSGFTLTNGATRVVDDRPANLQSSGGGLWCEATNNIVVSNCVVAGNSAYLYGGGAYQGVLTNCTLAGNWAANGGGAYACTLNNCIATNNFGYYGGGGYGGTLNNCIATNNFAYYGGGGYGGTLNNCTLTGNSGYYYGGGAFLSTLNNCTLTGNSAYNIGGGAVDCTLNNCTLTGNSASFDTAGAYSCTLNNCIVYFNSGVNYDNNSTLNYCCTTPQPPNGVGNISLDPQLASFSHISAGSPCRGAGSAAYASGADIDGEAWLSPPSIGCDEIHAGAITGVLSVAMSATYTYLGTGLAVDFTAQINGQASASRWEFGDGTVISNQPYASHSWTAPGDYVVMLRAFNESSPGGVSAALTVHVSAHPTHYVAAGSTNPIAPYTSWATAATNIPDAVAVSAPGAIILVTNGVYPPLAITKQRTIQSVNGAGLTLINGEAVTTCVTLINGAVLSGFTLTNGYGGYGGGAQGGTLSNCTLTGNSAYYSGGGASGCTLNNCTLSGNSAGSGGGAYGATLNGCTLTGNSAHDGSGGGAYACTLTNCTLTGNSVSNGGAGGGASGCTLNNCVVYFNTARRALGANYAASTLNYCCTTPSPTNGIGNTSLDPQLASASHLSASSPCRGAGNAAYASGSDIDGEDWANPPSIGCDEYHAGTLTGPLNVAIGTTFTNATVGFALQFTALIEGRPTASAWEFGDGVIVTNQPYTSHAWTVPGDYIVVLRAYNESQPAGISATMIVHVLAQPVHYVAPGSAKPVPPYQSWATAATNIQDAVDAATVPGALVLVTNGIYAGGAREAGRSTNRLVIDKPLTVQSVNGPQYAAIDGGGSVRCVYLTNGASLSGFTLTNGGNTYYYGGAVFGGALSNCTLSGNSSAWGGGAACDSTLLGCILTGNSAFGPGGGAYNCSLNNCTLSTNSVYIYSYDPSYGGGAYGCSLDHCTLIGNSASSFSSYGYGAGASACTLDHCTLTANSAPSGGAAAYACTLNHCVLATNSYQCASGCTLANCTLSGNSGDSAYSSTLTNCLLIANSGAGAYSSTLANCTLTGNSGYGAYYSALNNCAVSGNAYAGAFYSTLTNCTLTDNRGGGASHSTLNNCISYFNHGTNYDSSSTLNYCCTTPQPTNGVGNISVDPQVASASHLGAASPCRGAGNAAYSQGTDIDGEAWLSPPSIGCDEYSAGAVTGPLSAAITASYTNVTVGITVQFTAVIDGRTTASVWDFADGVTLTNQPYTSHTWSALGDYTVVLRVYNESQPGGINAAITIHVIEPPVHYVAQDSTNPVAPFTSWATAARNIQEAVNAATVPRAFVLVTNGVYAPIYVPALMTVRSVNGPQFTTIYGGAGSRCATLATNASLSGFTLSHGFASGSGGGAYGGTLTNCILSGNVAEAPLIQTYVCIYWDPVYHFCRGSAPVYSVGDAYGGGAAYCTLNNCTFIGNSVRAPLEYSYDYNSLTFSVGNAYGGAAAYCTLNNCTLTGNQAQTPLRYTQYSTPLDNSGEYGREAGGGGVYSCTLTNCALSNNRAQGYIGYIHNPYDGYAYGIYVPRLGGGALHSTLNNCTLTGNSDSGAYDCTLANCALTANVGPGALYSRLNNCTLTGNSELGASGCTLSNCIVYFNTGGNYDSFSCTLNYCCTTPQPINGVGNFSDDPQLSGASHLSFLSPCIGKGNHDAASGVDIDGEPWLNPPSIGCDEYHAGSVSGPLSVAITQSYTKVATNIPVQFTGWIDGRIAASSWDFADGVTITNQPFTSHAWTTPGDYAVVLRAYNESNPGGISATATVHVVTGLHFVSADSANPVSPFESWATAATNIQDAVTAAFEPGAQVLVTNGTYAPITLHGSLKVRSANGPLVTIIDGGRSNLCASLADGTSIYGFTLTNGTGGASGGTVNNCILTGNYGTGASYSTLNNCALTANSSGGASSCTLNNCTLTGNPASESEPLGPPGFPTGGGVSSSTLNNCIVYFNQGQNYDSSSILNYCCTTPLPTNGVGNISSEPQLAGAYRLSALSPCIGKGDSATVSGTDIDGEPWGHPPSMGCDEYHAGAVTGPLSVAISLSMTNVTVGYALDFAALIDGRTDLSMWAFGDGALELNRPYASHSYATPGDYTASLWAFSDSYPDGVGASVTIHVVAGVHYVAANSASPVAPYTSWATAATNIQDAITAVEPGGSVVVTNGTYSPIHASGPLTVRSVNGAQFTIIDGGHSNSCATLEYNDATLSGFTLTNGGNGYSYGAAYGGTLSNCILSGNSAFQGGGAAYCTLNNCTLSGNSAHQAGGTYHCTLNNCNLTGNTAAGGYGEGQGGGAAYSTLNNCTVTGNSGRYGGGTYVSTMNNCVLTGNSAAASTDGGFGGGAYGGTLNKCMLNGNSAPEGGGAIYSTLNNCTLTGNAAPGSNAGGGGAGGCTLNNCTLLGNSSGYGGGASGSTLNNCIVLDATAGCIQNHCWTTDPLFAANLRLQSNSPCINAGDNTYAVGSTDLDGNPRIAGGTVDIGAYEFQSRVSQISYAWLQQYGLPINSSTDTADPDADGVDNYHEWLAGTIPTSPLSSPAQLTITPSGTNVILTWPTNAVGFTLQSTTNLLSQAAWSTNSPAPVVVNGQNTVTNPITGALQFYRLIH